MPDPLSPKPASAAEFEACVKKYSGEILKLSILLLGPESKAEEIAVQSFIELHDFFLQDNLQAQALFLQAYRECIKQCARTAKERKFYSSRPLPWEERILQALRYGMRLGVPEISSILGKSIPAVKTQLRELREQHMASPEAKIPGNELSAG